LKEIIQIYTIWAWQLIYLQILNKILYNILLLFIY
jgi:hypothetical protein